MGNDASKSDSEGEKDFNERPEEAPLPPEPKIDPDIIENSEKGLDDNNFNMGITSNYEDVKKVLIKRSEEAGTQYVYRDVEFPAEVSSLYYNSDAASPDWDRYKWQRPYEFSNSPRLLKDGISSDDIIQGQLGNCWWLSSCAAIARQPKYMQKIIPKDQKLSGPDYVGMFHFRFWRFGTWIDVIVDDRLPTLYGRLVLGHSSNRDEFWLSLLEKAYAKLHGSYQALSGGFPKDGLEDLTGGMAISFELGDKAPSYLFRSMRRAFRNDSFVCASISGSGESVNKKTGLVSAHAYTITNTEKIDLRGNRVKLVRVRNPWGNNVEWKGDWSDESPLWNEVDSSVRYQLGYADKDNGEWWMTFEDFIYYFTGVTICTIGPDFDSDGAPTGDGWYLSMARGKWTSRSAGGCRNDMESYATNPQYYLELKEADDFDPDRDDPEEEGKCSVVLGLMQEYRRLGKSQGLENLYLGVQMFKVNGRPSRRLEKDYFRYHGETTTSGSYTNHREVSITAELDPGHYVIVPSSFYAQKQGSFLLRIFTEKPVDLEEL